MQELTEQQIETAETIVGGVLKEVLGHGKSGISSIQGEGGTPSLRGAPLELNESAKLRIAASRRPSFQFVRVWIKYCFCKQYSLGQFVPASLLHPQPGRYSAALLPGALLRPLAVLKRLYPCHWVSP